MKRGRERGEGERKREREREREKERGGRGRGREGGKRERDETTNNDRIVDKGTLKEVHDNNMATGHHYTLLLVTDDSWPWFSSCSPRGKSQSW